MIIAIWIFLLLGLLFFAQVLVFKVISFKMIYLPFLIAVILYIIFKYVVSFVVFPGNNTAFQK